MNKDGGLILTRNPGEDVVISDENGNVIAEVFNGGVNGCQVRMGFRADKRIKIHRREVWERIQKEGNKRQKPA